MIVVASANGDIGLPGAWEILRGGGSALDAVEAGSGATQYVTMMARYFASAPP